MSRIEDKVCKKIQARSDVGKAKYGTDMERTDLTNLEWLNHLQEELMDGAVYVEKIRERLVELMNSWITYGYDGSMAGNICDITYEPGDPLELFGAISGEEREEFITRHEDGSWEANEPGEWSLTCVKLSSLLRQ